MSTPPSAPRRFVLTGGGTGGHVYPALAVGQVLRERGHEVLYIGTASGIEARLVPESGFPMNFIRSSGMNRVGLAKKLLSAAQLPLGVATAAGILSQFRSQAVFSMGGFVAGPVMLAALLRRIPLIVMEPNATPGFANRKVGTHVFRALLAFEEAKRWFPADRVEITGLPVRPEFFRLPQKTQGVFTVLVTGGSRGARSLNRAARESWLLFQQARTPVRFIHQSGSAEFEALDGEFRRLRLAGEVVAFLRDMPTAFAQADLVVGRAGAGAVNEIAAAGMASVLVPFPFAADDHQQANAQALVNASAARLVLDGDLTGARLFDEVEQLRLNPVLLQTMRERVRPFARPGAAERAANLMELAASAEQ